jgi:hypothetical protein
MIRGIKVVFPHAEIDEACKLANWDKIVAMIRNDRLPVNYPFVNGQIVAPYPYNNPYQHQFTLIDHLYFREAPPEILQSLEEEFNALGYNDIYAFQSAQVGRWDIIQSLRPYLNIHAKDIMLSTQGWTLSDHAFMQHQLALAEDYYSENNTHFIKQTPTPILSPKLYIPAGSQEDQELVESLERQALFARNIQDMFSTAEVGSVTYTPLCATQRKSDIGYVGREVQSLKIKNIEPNPENIMREFKILS